MKQVKNKTIDLNSTEYNLDNILAFCNSEKYDDIKTSCFLETYRNYLKSGDKVSLLSIKFDVEVCLYPMRKDYIENGPLFYSDPFEPPEEFETKEKLIADIIKLEKELNIK